MDLDQLQSVRDRERQTDRLQQLRESFYEEAADFVADLRAERDAAAADVDDPFDSPQVNRLTDRIRTAEQTLEAIYEKRVGKVVKAATFAAADLPAEADGMTKEESALFDTLVDEIEANRATVLGRLRGTHDDSAPGSGGGASDTHDEADGDAVAAADLMGEGATDAADADPVPPDAASEAGEQPPPPHPMESDDPHDPASDPEATDGAGAADGDAAASPASSGDGDDDGAEDADVDRHLVRITDDVGPILGVDEREYDLSADDVVTLPAANAEPLVERGAAERLE